MNMGKLRDIIRKEMFRPSFLGVFINPFYISRKGLFKEISSLAHLIKGKVLDIGCGQKPYADLFEYEEYIGVELDTPENRKNKKADLFYNGRTLSVEDNSFDWVVCSQVLEHVVNPDEFLNEIYRVLKSGGGLLLTTPFVWDEHEQPFDYVRYSSFGLKNILEKHGFKIIEQKKTVGDIRIIFQLINAYLYKISMTKNQYVNLLFRILLMSPFNVLGELFYKVFPKNKDLYLDNLILAQKGKE